MTWTCEQIEARLSDYLDGLLSPDERHDFDMHANSCENCVQMVASVSHLVSDLHSMEQIEPPPQLVYFDSEPNNWAAQSQKRLARSFRLAERISFPSLRL